MAEAEEHTYSELEIHDQEVDFTRQWDVNISDVTFLVEDKKVYGSKGVLAMWSPVMKAMFFHDFKEKGSAEIPLPEKKYEDIMKLMKVLHPPIENVDEGNVAALLPLAREYQIMDLTRRCERFLLSKSPSLANLVLADEYSLADLRKVCTKYTQSRSFSQLTSESGWDDMTKDTKTTVLLEKAGKYEAQCKFTLQKLGKIEAIANGDEGSRALCTGSSSSKRHIEGTNKSCEVCTEQMLRGIRAVLREVKSE